MMNHWQRLLFSGVLASSLALGACSGGDEKSDPVVAEQPAFLPLENLPTGTKVVTRVDPARTESFQAAAMSRFEGNAPISSELDVALAATSAALVFPPQPGRLFGAPPAHSPLPSLDRTRPIYHALTTEPAIGFVDSLMVGRTPVQSPSLGARLYLPATDAEKLDSEFGFFCEDGRNQSMTDGCKTVASHEARNGWVVVELDYGGQPARVRTSGATGFSRQTPAVEAFADEEAAVAVWFDTTAAAEVGAVMEWHAYSFGMVDADNDPVAAAERNLESMAPILRSSPGARETEDITITLRVEGENELAVDAVRTFTQRGLARAEAGAAVESPRSFDVKNPVLRGELPWSMAGIRAATEPPVWSVGEADYGRIGSGFWRRVVPWVEAPFAYYVGLAWGPRPSRSAGWLRVVFSLDGARLRLDAVADAASPVGFNVNGGTAVVSMGNQSQSAVSTVVESFTRQAASMVGAAYDFELETQGERNDVVALMGTARSTAPVAPGNSLLYADLVRIADLLDASGNTDMFGPQLSAALRAAGGVELTWDRSGAAEAWRLHVGTGETAEAQAPVTEVSPLLLEPLDVCVLEARREAVKSLRAQTRGGEATPPDFADIATRCTTDEGKRLLAAQ